MPTVARAVAAGHARPISHKRICPASPETAAVGPLVIRGAAAVVVCRYGPLPGHELIWLTEVRQAYVVKRLISEFDALPKHTGGDTWVCASDNGSEIVAEFKYAHRAALSVHIALTGCDMATRGDDSRITTTAIGARLLSELEHLLTVRDSA
jgi:hypothetical protein